MVTLRNRIYLENNSRSPYNLIFLLLNGRLELPSKLSENNVPAIYWMRQTAIDTLIQSKYYILIVSAIVSLEENKN